MDSPPRAWNLIGKQSVESSPVSGAKCNVEGLKGGGGRTVDLLPGCTPVETSGDGSVAAQHVEGAMRFVEGDSLDPCPGLLAESGVRHGAPTRARVRGHGEDGHHGFLGLFGDAVDLAALS